MRPSPNPLAAVTPALRARLHSAFGILLEAFVEATRAQRNPWDFAVRMSDLHAAGLTANDLRRLFSNKYVQHAVEKTRPGSKRRVFGGRGAILFEARSCFVLTETGVRAARVFLGEIPFYDRELRELWARGQLVKPFRQRAPDQETILSSFEELGWPRRIDDPLPRKADSQDSKLRLRDAIKRLNQHQQRRLIRFRGDGTGQGLIWEFVDRPDA